MVFASVVRNDKILEQDGDILQQMLNPGGGRTEKVPDYTIPEITELADVYETGALCLTKVIHDERNTFMPYVVNLFPQQKAVLNLEHSNPNNVGPLSNVIVDIDKEGLLSEEEIPVES
jgi:hypothetical protein